MLEAIPLEQVTAAGYGFQVEMTYRAILLGFRVVEVPITFREREHGSSKIPGARSGLSATDTAHAALILVSCFSIVYVIFVSWQNSHQSNRDMERNLLVSAEETIKLPEISTRPLSYYEENVAGRDLFSLVQSSGTPGVSNVSTVTDTTPEVLRNLQLQGILFDQSAQAIIRDPASQQTFFVREGEAIKGAVVKHIEEGKVALDYQGQPIELIRK